MIVSQMNSKIATDKRDLTAKCDIVTTLVVDVVVIAVVLIVIAVVVDDPLVFVGAHGRFFSPRLKQFRMTLRE